MPEFNEDTVPAAAIRRGHIDDLSPLLRSVAGQLGRQGWRIRGIIQTRETDIDGNRSRVLHTIDGSGRFPVSQRLGRQSQACSLDTQALADAAAALRGWLDEGPDLLIVDRFGPLEAQSKGFTTELLEIMSRGVPLLTSVKPAEEQAWTSFTGGLAHWVPPEPKTVCAWAHTVMPRPERMVHPRVG